MINKLLLLAATATSPLQLQNEVSNLQSELQMVYERMETQEKLIDVLRQEIDHTLTSTKGSTSKFTDVSKDMVTLKDHINTVAKEVEKQGKSIKQLETALKALVEAVSPEKATAGYKVKSGDSLEKIAKEHGTTPKAIKELNNLQKDTIYVGQNLVLP